MGLNCSHKVYEGSYGRFVRFSEAVAIAAGFEVREESDGTYFFRHELNYEDKYRKENAEGRWPEEPSDIILVLIFHSDCDGVIEVRHLCPLASRLAALIPSLDELNRDTSVTFVKGLLNAFIDNEEVVFG